MNSHFDYGFITHSGLVRNNNEDYVGFFPADDSLLVVIADGMGGHNAGETASRICVETMGNIFLDNPAAEPETILRNGLQQANDNVLHLSAKDAHLSGMGTTVAVAILRGDECWYSHVGDSRIYLVEAGKIRRLTCDHTVVQSMVDAGLITEAQAVGHYLAHAVSKAIGHIRSENLDLDVGMVPLGEGSSIMLCSDGLTNHVSDEEIYRRIHGANAQDDCKSLLDLVLQRGAYDNISIQLIRYGH